MGDGESFRSHVFCRFFKVIPHDSDDYQVSDPRPCWSQHQSQLRSQLGDARLRHAHPRPGIVRLVLGFRSHCRHRERISHRQRTRSVVDEPLFERPGNGFLLRCDKRMRVHGLQRGALGRRDQLRISGPSGCKRRLSIHFGRRNVEFLQLEFGNSTERSQAFRVGPRSLT